MLMWWLRWSKEMHMVHAGRSGAVIRENKRNGRKKGWWIAYLEGGDDDEEWSGEGTSITVLLEVNIKWDEIKQFTFDVTNKEKLLIFFKKDLFYQVIILVQLANLFVNAEHKSFFLPMLLCTCPASFCMTEPTSWTPFQECWCWQYSSLYVMLDNAYAALWQLAYLYEVQVFMQVT